MTVVLSFPLNVDLRRYVSEAGVPFDALDSGDAVTARFPYLAVPATHAAVVDSIGGFVDPGRMVQVGGLLWKTLDQRKISSSPYTSRVCMSIQPEGKSCFDLG